MPAQVIARRAAGGGWLLERDGTSLAEEPIADDELLERIEELLVVGWLDPADRISIVEADGPRSSGRILELLPAGSRSERERDGVLAERWAGDERYV